MRYYGKFEISEQICFLWSYENREVLANLKTDSDKNLTTTNFRRNTTPYKIL